MPIFISALLLRRDSAALFDGSRFSAMRLAKAPEERLRSSLAAGAAGVDDGGLSAIGSLMACYGEAAMCDVRLRNTCDAFRVQGLN